jgi:H+/gluconate symporter-like permease
MAIIHWSGGVIIGGLVGEKKALLAISLASMVITAVGVFIAVSVIIVAPIALSVAKRYARSSCNNS